MTEAIGGIDDDGEMDVYTVVGLAGVAGYVASYGLLQLGMLDGNGATYSVANVASASLVLVSLTSDFNLASAMIQVIWIAIGVVGLILHARRRRAAHPDAAIVDAAGFTVASGQLRSVTRAAFVGTAGRSFDLRPDVAAAEGNAELRPNAAPLAS